MDPMDPMGINHWAREIDHEEVRAEMFLKAGVVGKNPSGGKWTMELNLNECVVRWNL